MPIAMDFNDLGLTPEGMPWFGVTEAASSEWAHADMHLQDLALCSPYSTAFFLQHGSNSHSLLQARINCWERDGMGCNAGTDTPWGLGFLRNYGQIPLLTWQKWARLLADTSENSKNAAPVRKLAFRCKWTFLRSCTCKDKVRYQHLTYT